jgi:hypothetical protein
LDFDLEEVCHLVDEVDGFDGFLEVALGGWDLFALHDFVEVLLAEVIACVGGDDEHGDCGELRVGAEALVEGHAGLPRHDEIERDGVGLGFFDAVVGVLSVGGGGHLEPCVLEGGSQKGLHVGLVFDDEYGLVLGLVHGSSAEGATQPPPT